MIRKLLFLFTLLCVSCSSDSIISSEKTSFYKVYKDIIYSRGYSTSSKDKKEKTVYNKAWLSKFNQPIILLSSLDGKNNATLVARGSAQTELALAF